MQIIKKQEAAKKSIKNSCQSCKGQGCRDCAFKVECINLWSKAGIPVSYWNYSIQTFSGDSLFKTRLEKLIKNIDSLYNDGRSLVFTGPHGVGKTFAACEILKNAVMQGYLIKYTTMNEIIDMATVKEERYEFKTSLLYYDFVLIDELDSRFIPNTERAQETFGANLENIIRSRFQNKLPILFCTNNASLTDVFESSSFQQTFSSLFTDGNLLHIPVGGIDLRKC